MIRIGVLTAIGLAFSACSAAAAAQATDAPAAQTIIDQIDEPTLLSAVAKLGAEAETLGDTNDTYRIVYPNGSRAILRRTACAQEACRGLLMLAYFSLPKDRSAAEVETARREFSANFNPASVITNDLDEHIVKSYLIFDGGVTTDNLTVRLAVFGDAVQRYGRALYGVEEQDAE